MTLVNALESGLSPEQCQGILYPHGIQDDVPLSFLVFFKTFFL